MPSRFIAHCPGVFRQILGTDAPDTIEIDRVHRALPPVPQDAEKPGEATRKGKSTVLHTKDDLLQFSATLDLPEVDFPDWWLQGTFCYLNVPKDGMRQILDAARGTAIALPRDSPHSTT